MKKLIISFLAGSALILFLMGWVATANAYPITPSYGVGTNAANGRILQTNGITSTWVNTSTLGITSGVTSLSAVLPISVSNPTGTVSIACATCITTSTFNATGTPNYIPAWNASGTGLTSTSSLYQSSSTQGIGIGTTTVPDKLDVANASGTNSLIVLSTSTPNNLFEVDTASSTAAFSIASSSAANLSGSVQFSGISSVTTGSIGGSALLAGACSSATTAISSIFSVSTSAVFTMPVTYPGDGTWWESYISSPGVLTTKVCVAVAGTPTASVYNVKLIL